MKAVVFEAFAGPVTIQSVADPAPTRRGVVIRTEATGICRSDWHGWMGHDPDVALPHVPGHELAGVIEDVGSDVTQWQRGDRVTLPFICGCGICSQCVSGNHQVCDHQFQPGFTHWGSFAQYVAIDYAEANLVRLPQGIDSVAAASLGCRFTTSYRAIVDQGRLAAGQWVAVHGCGGVGLSAVMIASAFGAGVVAIDISSEKLQLAAALGATTTVDASQADSVPDAVFAATGGGAHLSIDALGHPRTCLNSILCLRKRGRHVQVGLMLADQSRPPVPMDRVVAYELELLGSHGMQAHRFGPMLEMIDRGQLHPEKLIGATISLEESPLALSTMDSFAGSGITVIDSF